MNYLLFQPEVLTEKDRVYKNGKLINDSSEFSSTYDFVVKLVEEAGSNNYPWIGKIKGYYVVRGLFNVKDEKGRTLSFLFVSDSCDFKSELQEIAQKIEKEVSNKTYQAIDTFIDYNKKKHRLVRIAVPVFLAFIIILIISLCSH